MFDKLAAYKIEHNHCNVPGGYEADPALATWVGTQRNRAKTGTIGPEQKKMLDDLGFHFDPFQDTWETSFAELVEFSEKHGHCNVSETDNGFGQLGKWSAVQRRLYRTNELETDRISRLEALGYRCNPQEAKWYKRYQELTEFKKLHGHCRAVAKGKTASPLGGWCSKQRGLYKAGKLPKKRKRLLEALGFEWVV